MGASAGTSSPATSTAPPARPDLDEPVQAGASQAITSNIEAVARSRGAQCTKRKLLQQMVLGSRQAPLVASAGQVAEALIEWVAAAGVDGFNLSRTVAAECFADFGRWVVPWLQSRGLFKTAYRPGTLRDKLFGHTGLPASYPASVVVSDGCAGPAPMIL